MAYGRKLLALVTNASRPGWEERDPLAGQPAACQAGPLGVASVANMA